MDKCFLLDFPEDSRYHEPNRRPIGGFAWPPPSPYASSTSLHAHHSFPFSSMSAKVVSEDGAKTASKSHSQAEKTASKSHSQAEKLRRERINAHFAALRKLIPRSDKMDKATLLGSVMEHTKDLKTRAAEISQTFLVPTEVDEVIIDCEEILEPMNNNNNKGNIFIKVSICSEDRPELFTDIIEALKGLRLTTVKADMATVGGRIINVMTLSVNNYDKGSSLKSLKQTLKVVLSGVASSPAVSMSARTSKRQKTLLPSYYSESHIDHQYESFSCVAAAFVENVAGREIQWERK